MSDDNFREVYGWATTEDEAKAKAKAQAERIERGKRKVEVTMPGNASIVAGMHVTLERFRPGMSGRYKIVTVRHSVTRSAWTTTITGEGA